MALNGNVPSNLIRHQELLDHTDLIVEEMLSGTFVRQRAAVDSLHTIMFELSNLFVFEDLFFNHQLAPHFLRFLEATNEDDIKFVGAKILRRVVIEFRDRALELVQHGGATTLVVLIDYGRILVTLEVIQALDGASEHPLEFKEALIQSDAIRELSIVAGHEVEVLTRLIPTPENDVAELVMSNYTFLHRVLRILNYLCTIAPPPAVLTLSRVGIMFPLLRSIILGINQNHPALSYANVCTDACSTFCCLLRMLIEPQQVQNLVTARLCRRLVWLMQWLYARPDLVEAAHLIVRRFLWTSQASVDVLIDEGLPQALRDNLIQIPLYQLKACKTIDCAIFYNPNSIQQIVFDGDMIGSLIQILNNEEGNGEHELRTEAISVFRNIVVGGTDVQIGILCESGCIGILCRYLNMNNTRAFCAEALQGIIQAGDRNRVDNVNVHAATVAQLGLDTINNLINDEEVGDIARWIQENIN